MHRTAKAVLGIVGAKLMPDLPARSHASTSFSEFPMVAKMPNPVTTTRRIMFLHTAWGPPTVVFLHRSTTTA
jgi:hypothetical protein